MAPCTAYQHEYSSTQAKTVLINSICSSFLFTRGHIIGVETKRMLFSFSSSSRRQFIRRASDLGECTWFEERYVTFRIRWIDEREMENNWDGSNSNGLLSSSNRVYWDDLKREYFINYSGEGLCDVHYIVLLIQFSHHPDRRDIAIFPLPPEVYYIH